ncbi:hypothetical protein TMatcc_004831 [Talaromyces marneffei ATCC 18224]|uniref:Multiple myeloma tumor-associated protein 2-like N-terminal domain-containing protein n=2 Tax=Talaromyces marneffei TaxID=37727 RepID=B6Q200_TALMQ|nr:uncharacterized protein EYB26_000249 [Talaromyces marneffei]EEA26884.1 conserved hypothetical protein [Talaromyces marneffei ATCC 18224]KAE8557378.1 hypothetical protein EYB25_002085 [Talaromyces marneffei]QGA12605.1 hypothetical protein EYB26_000249 [Talaromyces marneffei]
MDLVAGVRKEGSRGGRDSFKWSDVKESSHREKYLGHSIMAPVGRWQQNRDLNWYAKSDASSAEKAKQEREEEIRRIKEAEQDAMALALGLPVAPRASNNANMTPLGGSEVRKAVQESTDVDDKADGDGGRGLGFGSYGGAAAMKDAEDEILAPIGMDSDMRISGQEKDGKDRGHRSRRDRSRDHDRRRDREHRDRDRSGRHRNDRDADREHRHHHRREDREHKRHRSRSRSVSRSPRPERRERRPDSDRHRDAGRTGRHRSSSPRRDRDHEGGRDAHHRYHR